MNHPAEDLPDGPFAPQGRPEAIGPDGQHRFERAGKRLTIAGLSCLAGGGLLLGLSLASSENSSGEHDLGAGILGGVGVYVGGVVTGAGGILTIVGGSLWGAGVSKRHDIENHKTPLIIPEIGVGPGSISLTWQL